MELATDLIEKYSRSNNLNLPDGEKGAGRNTAGTFAAIFMAILAENF